MENIKAGYAACLLLPLFGFAVVTGLVPFGAAEDDAIGDTAFDVDGGTVTLGDATLGFVITELLLGDSLGVGDADAFV